MADEQMDVKRPRQKVRRQIKRSNIALDEYMFERKMQSLYYGKKPKSDDTPAIMKWLRLLPNRLKNAIKLAPLKIKALRPTVPALVKKYPVRFLVSSLALMLVVIFSIPYALRLTHNKPLKPGTTSVLGVQQGGDGQSVDGNGQPVATSRVPLHQKPDFLVVLPQGKTAEDLGGWAKVSPTGTPATYAYKDMIGPVHILVSEQLLPESFKTDTHAQVEKLAIGFNASQSVKTEKSEFFIGINSDGEQSVISYNKTLLIFLKSSAKIANDRWQTYIEDLR